MIGILAGLAMAGVGRGFALYRSGVRLIAIDRQRSVSQGLRDLAIACLFGLWFWEALAFAWPFEAHLAPTFLHGVAVAAPGWKLLGAAAMALGLGVYVLALGAFGTSWRLGIDRETPGALVTSGIFAWSRNPIYLALDLLVLGSFGILGRWVFALVGLLQVALLHDLILREERFLASHYGDAYRSYRSRVGRYFTWRRRRRPAA